MSPALPLPDFVAAARPHLLSVALILARLAPAAFLSPILGGQAVPTLVRLGLCLSLAAHVHWAGGVCAALPRSPDLLDVLAAFARELACGATLGLIAALPFDAARMGGRLMDTLRGANAEAALPVTGSREAASGDLLYQLLTALAFAGPVFRLVAAALVRSFQAAALGLPAADGVALADLALLRATAALSAGLAIGAPVAAVSLLVELALGLASRVAPALALRELAAPARLLAGAAAALLVLGAASDRLLRELGQAASALESAAAVMGSPR